MLTGWFLKSSNFWSSLINLLTPSTRFFLSSSSFLLQPERLLPGVTGDRILNSNNHIYSPYPQPRIDHSAMLPQLVVQALGYKLNPLSY